jgi:hypothetical protein
MVNTKADASNGGKHSIKNGVRETHAYIYKHTDR